MTSFPRLLYNGSEDADAETRRVASPEELDQALAEGWRLYQIPALHRDPTDATDAPLGENISDSSKSRRAKR